jgi:hypothetical protein
MKLSDVRENYNYFSGKASDIVRQLGFAGIAVIWVFKTDIAGRPAVPTELLPAAILIVIGLALDFLHYIIGSLIWATYNGIKERAGTTAATEFLAPRPINWPTLSVFWLKILVMSAAYTVLVRFLISRLYI